MSYTVPMTTPCSNCGSRLWETYRGHLRCRCGHRLWIERHRDPEGGVRFKLVEGIEPPKEYRGWAEVTA